MYTSEQAMPAQLSKLRAEKTSEAILLLRGETHSRLCTPRRQHIVVDKPSRLGFRKLRQHAEPLLNNNDPGQESKTSCCSSFLSQQK
jgi:hypothetical protein